MLRIASNILSNKNVYDWVPKRADRQSLPNADKYDSQKTVIKRKNKMAWYSMEIIHDSHTVAHMPGSFQLHVRGSNICNKN